MRVIATTVIRGDSNPELTGYLFEIDWHVKSVKRKVPIPVNTSHPFWNARGGNRGGRGVVFFNGVLFVATATSILKYDVDMKLIGTLDHKLFAGLHEMFVDSDGIWLTSTVHDLVLKIDFNGEIIDKWWGSESEQLQSIFNYTSRNLNIDMKFSEAKFAEEYDKYCKDERLHINTVWKHGDEVYVLSCWKQAFIRIRPMSEKIIVHDSSLMAPHNGIISDRGEILINNTMKQALNVYDLTTGQLLREIPTKIYDEHVSEQFAKSGWQRGLAHMQGSKYLVGTSPATIFEVDIDTGAIGHVLQLDNDVRHCIHGLAVVDNF